MVFRDDREALRLRNEEQERELVELRAKHEDSAMLRKRLAKLERELAKSRPKKAKTDQPVDDSGVTPRQARAIVMGTIVLAAAIVVGGGAWVTWLTASPAGETIRDAMASVRVDVRR